MKRFDKWLILDRVLWQLEKDLKLKKSRLNTKSESESAKRFYQGVTERREREIEEVKKWMEEYE